MKKVLIIVALLSSACYADSQMTVGEYLEQLSKDNPTGFSVVPDASNELEQYNECVLDFQKGKRMAELAEVTLAENEFDRAWQLTEMAFRSFVRTFSCNTYPIKENDQMYHKVQEELDALNILDDKIACRYHMHNATAYYTRSELALSHFDDLEKSIYYMNATIFSYEDAKRFCPSDTGEQIDTIMPSVIQLRDNLVNLQTRENGD